MTLREGLIELTEQLREQGKMVVLLDAMLAQTADDDAERDEYAEIGRLVTGMLTTENSVRVSRFEGDEYSATTYRDDGRLGYEKIFGEGGSLLDALESLKAKTEGK